MPPLHDLTDNILACSLFLLEDQQATRAKDDEKNVEDFKLENPELVGRTDPCLLARSNLISS